jgi:MFS transporter, DHA2 family, multidrug resistance protein
VSDAPALPPMHGWRLALATVALALGNFMEVLDTTIANVSVPSIAGHLGVSPGQGTWVITSYAVANAISVLLCGFLAQRYGQVRVFTTAVVLFGLASLACGFSTSFPMLVSARVAQGSVSGLMVPLTQVLIAACWPPQRRAVGLAIWAMTITVAPILGPILGGWITDNIGWSWIFFINVPIAAGTAILAWSLLSTRESHRARVPVDWVGLALIVLWVGTLQIMLDKGNELDWFGSTEICLLALISAIGFIVFLIWELTAEHPIVDLRLFRIPSFSGATIALCLGFAVFFASVVLLPLWLQTSLGYTATWAGLALAPAGVLAVVFSPMVGRSMDRIDPRIYASLAFIAFAVVSWWRASFTTDADFASVALPQLAQGVAIALFFPPLITLSLGHLPRGSIAQGSGLTNFLRMTAGAFATSGVIALWDHRQADHREALSAGLTAFDPAFARATDTLVGLGASADQARAVIDTQLATQVASLGIFDIFWLSGWLFLLVIPAVWITRRIHMGGPVGH